MSQPRFLLIALIASLLLSCSVPSYATGIKAAGTHVYGRVVDSKTKKPVDYASVSLLAAARDSLIAGILTESNGDFSIDNITPGSYRLRVTFMGYTPYERPLVLVALPELDLGNIALEAATQKIGEVTVTAEKAAVTMTVDRKVFNVDKDISARGGNGLDVMKNIPGVTIDADGNVALRNNTPQIYVDGKPTSLTLDQIPSDEIDRVEVITNPSAKYEAAASGGILNVVMKHNTKPGYNGFVYAFIGTNLQWNGSVQASFHRRKFGFMLGYTTNGMTNVTTGFNNRTNLDVATHDASSYYDQNTLRTNRRSFHTVRLGIDYFITNRNTLTLTENLNFPKNIIDIDASIISRDAHAVELSHSSNFNHEQVTRRTFTTNLDFKHTYPRAGKEYTIALSYERFHSMSQFLDTSQTYSPAGNILPGSAGYFAQSIPSGVESHMVTAQWDFVQPLRDSVHLEYGLRSYYKRTETFADVSDYIDSLATFQPDAQLSSRYLTQELVNAAYITVGQQVRRFSYQVGLRFEGVYFEGSLLNKNQQFSYAYPQKPSGLYESFFPSFYLSERLSAHHQLQLNATRKTNRPSGGQINPNIEVIDQYDYTVGNPALTPEFINQGELNYTLTIPKFDWLTSGYLKYTEHPITSFSYIDSAGHILATYLNGKGKFSYGWENTFKINPTKNLNINLSGNIFYTSIQAYPDPTHSVAVNNSGVSWTAKAMVNYKFPLGFSAQVNGSYEAPKILPQGRATAVYFFDISVSKDFGIATVNLSVSDVLNSKTHGTEYITPEFIQNSSRRREARFAKIGVTFRFGKEEKTSRSRKPKKEGREKEEEE